MKIPKVAKRKILKILSTAVLPTIILVVICLKLASTYDIFKQSEAFGIVVPNYNINLQIPIAGTMLYQNINQNKYGKVDSILAAKGELLIRLKDNVPLDEIALIAHQYNMDILERYRQSAPSFRLRLSEVSPTIPTQEDTNPTSTTQSTSDTNIWDSANPPKSDGRLEQIWQELDPDSRIFSVAPNAINYLNGYWPNDPGINPKPGLKPELEKIQADKAWEQLQKLGLPAGGKKNIWIAVIDTGVDLDHPDLVDNIAKTEVSGDIIGKSFEFCEEGKYKEPCKDWIEVGGTSGGDGIDNDNKDGIDEAAPHGTKVAGIAAEVGDNNINAAGVAFTTKIVSLNVGNLNGDEFGTTVAIIKAVDFAVSLTRVRIINCSFGSLSTSPEQENAYNNAWNKGKLIVAGAGNNGNDKEFYPAGYKNVIAVASVDTEYLNPKKSFHSNFGSWVDISAYGGGIYTTTYNDTYNYSNITGATSFSSPLVAGSAALLWSYHSNLTNEQIFKILIQNASAFSNSYFYEGLMGCGIVNPYLAIASNAPIVNSPECFSKFIIGQASNFAWEPYPGTSPTKYWFDLEWGGSKRPPFIPYDPLHPDAGGIDLGLATHKTFSSKFIETNLFIENKPGQPEPKDGLWGWRIASEINGQKFWSSWKYINKETIAEVTEPIFDQTNLSSLVFIKRSGQQFCWKPVEGATNYVMKLTHDTDSFYYSLNQATTCYTMTEKEYDLLWGGTYSWNITGTSLTGLKKLNDPLTKKLPFGSKGVGIFMVPTLDLWGNISVKPGVTVTFRNKTNQTHELNFWVTPPNPDIPPFQSPGIPPDGIWTHKFDILGEYGFNCIAEPKSEHQNEMGYVSVEKYE